MCGIAGIYSFSSVAGEVRGKVEDMIRVQHHRGPDDNGVSVVSEEPSVVLGQARLSIIDLSMEARQPMTDRTTGNVIVFNGEIYNFQEIKKELANKGYRFSSRSDTEVILYAYAEWGEACVTMLRGIFAFAIWDNRKKCLFIARDQMGVKPFYCHQSAKGCISFASEVRALLASGVPRKISREGLASFMNYGSVQEPFTLVRNVYSLPPASYAVVKDGKMEIVRYWDPFAMKQDNSIHTKEEVNEVMTGLLRESVSMQMVSDVPLGAFLSGGIDSSAIVALMRQSIPDADLRTFAIVFDQKDYDERKYSRLAAERNHTQHTELELDGAMVKQYLKQALSSFDQPSMDGLNTWFVSRLVRESGITVALSGVGGDELFVGYNDFNKPLLFEKWKQWFSLIPDFAGRWGECLAGKEALRKMADLISFPYQPYFVSRRVFTERQISRLLDKKYSSPLQDWFLRSYGGLCEQPFTDAFNRISYFESRSYMLSTLLRDTDQMSMAHSLEVRVPLIDHRIAEYIWQLPAEWKVNPGVPKSLLVESAGKGLPEECVFRKKQGFVFPFDKYFKEELGDELRNFFHTSTCPLFDSNGLRALWVDYEKGKISWSRIWMLFVLQYWLEENKIEF